MNEELLAAVRIILVEPAGALNVGAIARTLKNLGLSQLVLVNPHCDPLGEEARRMAVHAQDILEKATIVDSLPAALTGCVRAIATTARPRALDTVLESPRVALPWLCDSSTPSALIFGPEDRGLSNQELNYAQRFVRIPTSDAYPSLNLAQSVAICAYELSQSVAGDMPPAAMGGLTPVDFNPSASMEAIEGYYQQLESVLLKIGYLYPHTAATRMEKFRRIYNRAGLSNQELAMLRGILSQVEWAISHLKVSSTDD
jgi:tRNA/rRNA methyltransferase